MATKAKARQARIQKQIKQVLRTFDKSRVFSAHDMATAMGEIWARPPNQREVAHSLIRLGGERVISRARHMERVGIAGNTNMWSVDENWQRRELGI